MSFGTGAVKVTPAHDPNDFEIGRRGNLPAINIMNPDGTINAQGGPFEGMTMPAARSAVVARLEQDRSRSAASRTIPIRSDIAIAAAPWSSR